MKTQYIKTIILLVAVWSSMTASAQLYRKKQPVLADTYIKAQAAKTSFGNSTIMQISSTPSKEDIEDRFLLSIDLKSYENCQLTKGILFLSLAQVQNVKAVDVYPVDSPLDEQASYWDNQPKLKDSKPIRFAVPDKEGMKIRMDLTEILNQAINNQTKQLTLVIQAAEQENSGSLAVYTKETSQLGLQPELDIVYYSTEDGGTRDLVDIDYNWTQVTTYKDNNEVLGQSRSYYDKLGRHDQTQVKNYSSRTTTVSKSIYDAQGRSAISFLPGVDMDVFNFNYRNDIVLDENENTYDYNDFEGTNPSIISSQSIIGKYYNNNNQKEDYVPHTSYPFTRTEYSNIQPGKVRKTAAAGDVLRFGNGNETLSLTLDGSIDELPNYMSFDPNIHDANDFSKLIKNLTVDADGHTVVAFSDFDGNLIASGHFFNATTINPASYKFQNNITDPYLDLHLGVDKTITFSEAVELTNLSFYSLTSDQPINPLTGGSNTIYIFDESYIRIVYSGQIPEGNSLSVTTTSKYENLAYNYYDMAGRLKKTLPPEGTTYGNLANTFTYNNLGWLLNSTTPDQGTSNFVYRRDGAIRFSQNAYQAALNPKQMSYTAYDASGRIIESGVYTFDNVLGNTFSGFQGQYEGSSASSSIHSALEDIADVNDLTSHIAGLPITCCSERSQIHYDLPDPNLLVDYESELDPAYHKQRFVNGNVSYTWNENSKTWYSYDYKGNVEWTVIKISELDEPKTVEYTYDFLNNVTQVEYQKGKDDAFIHQYIYRNDNQLIEVLAGKPNHLKKQVEYEYYLHGPLKRQEIAGIQGLDYVYTINGALKAINHPTLLQDKDPGDDANDLFGMALDYHSNDYTRYNSLINFGAETDYYNGKIASMRWKISDQNIAPTSPQLLDPTDQWGYQFAYTSKGWLESSAFGIYKHNALQNDINNDNTGEEPVWNLGNNYSTSYVYDKNGNISQLNRNAYGTSGYQMDQLTYNYLNTDGKLVNNQLQFVEDAIGGTPFDTDMNSQLPGNYMYDQLGRLTEDKQTNVAYQYTATSRLSQAKYPSPNRDAPWTMDYKYNESGFRICKQNGNVNSFYIRDASGNILAVYKKIGDDAAQLIETPVYASGRVGVYYEQLGKTLYELKDHLGNVRVVFKKGVFANAVKLNETDYYPFGFEMPGRNNIAENYRFGFQGEFAEKDEETGFNHFELRAYDSRISRWMITDPENQYASPYLAMGNCPNQAIDPTGGLVPWYKGLDGSLEFVTDGVKPTDGFEYFGPDGMFGFNEYDASLAGVLPRAEDVGMSGGKGSFRISMTQEQSLNFMETQGYRLANMEYFQYDQDQGSIIIQSGPNRVTSIRLGSEIKVVTKTQYIPKDMDYFKFGTQLDIGLSNALVKEKVIHYKASTSHQKLYLGGGKWLFTLIRGLNGNHDYRNKKVYYGWENANNIPKMLSGQRE